MQKEYEYKGYFYRINVELNAKAERHIDGKQWDLVSIDCYKVLAREKYVERDSLLSRIKLFSLEVQSKIDDIDNKKTGFEKILADMGFK